MTDDIVRRVENGVRFEYVRGDRPWAVRVGDSDNEWEANEEPLNDATGVHIE